MGFLKDLHKAGKEEMKKRDRERAEEERRKIELLNEINKRKNKSNKDNK